MSLYIFETMTAANAAGFVPSQDFIVIGDRATTALNITISQNPAANQVTLTTVAGVSRTFDAGLLQDGSLAARIGFDGSNTFLVTGTSANNVLAFGPGVPASFGGVFHGLDGNDTINANNQPTYAFGGNGNDVITGGDGNDHLYGFGLTGDPSNDGNDSINGGAGSDYIQGNAGDDTLAGGTGSDRIQGGQGNDVIRGEDGNDVVNGNRGNDTISGGDGNDNLRGGQGDDRISGDGGDDILFGDLGNDRLIGGQGFDVMSGGAGNDVFAFGAGEALYSATGPNAFVSDRIVDFRIGEDKIDFGAVVAARDSDIRHAPTGTTVTNLSDAGRLAQRVIDDANALSPGANASAVVAIQVGADTYLFYGDNGNGTVNSMIRLEGVVAADFTGSSIFH